MTKRVRWDIRVNIIPANGEQKDHCWLKEEHTQCHRGEREHIMLREPLFHPPKAFFPLVPSSGPRKRQQGVMERDWCWELNLGSNSSAST